MAYADNLSIGVQTSSVNLGIHIGNTPPPVVVVPGPVVVAQPGHPAPPPPPVYTPPDLPYNYYFVYQSANEGRRSRQGRKDACRSRVGEGAAPRAGVLFMGR